MKWLNAALDYLPRWLELQMRWHEQAGCAIAIAHKGRIVLEEAFGYADLARRERLTPQHRFRVASHSKSFTAAGIMKLRERERLKLDDCAGRYVKGLHPAVAQARVGQLLSHSAGIVRDGADSGQFLDRRPFLDGQELRADLAAAPVLEASTRFKYSNHGYGLLGLVIEAVSGEPWRDWIRREIVDAAGLRETLPDAPLPRGTPLAAGHSDRLPVGHRVVIPGNYSTRAIAPAGGVAATAGDLARFFAQLAPNARRSVLSAESRREMVRRQWRDPHSSLERYYGLGTISGTVAGWEWFGHSGGLQGYITRTCVFAEPELAVSVLTNSVDGLAHLWLDGAAHVLRAFAQNGAPARRVAGWTGRWWTLWGGVDLLPMGGKVMVAGPASFNPMVDASEIEVQRRDAGRIALAGGYASHGEPARLLRDGRGRLVEVRLGGVRFRSEASVAREMASRYQRSRA